MKRFAIAALALLLLAPRLSYAQFKIKNVGDAADPVQAEVDSVDIDILVTGTNGIGVISGCAVTAQGTPDMTVAVASGTVRVGTTVASVSSGNVTITAAHATLKRLDLVVVNSSGTKSVTAGTAATAPAFPPIPANSVVLASVLVLPTDTTIETDKITPKHMYLGFVGALTTLTAGRIPFVGTGGLITDDSSTYFIPASFTLVAGRGIFGSEIAGDMVATGIGINQSDSAGQITFEGATGNSIESRIGVVDPTVGDQLFQFPNTATAGTFPIVVSGFANVGITGLVRSVEAVTTTKTTTAAETWELYANTGDSDGSTITLLNDPTIGTSWLFAVDASQTQTIQPSAGETLYFGASTCATLASNTPGSTLTITTVVGGSGGKFMVTASAGSWTCS